MLIGIDFGQTNTYVAELKEGKATVIKNSRNMKCTPSTVAIINKLPYVGNVWEIRETQVNEENVVSRMKGIIARNHDKKLIQQYCKDWRINMIFKCGVPKFCLTSDVDEGFTIEEIVALLFSCVTQNLKKIDGAVITVPSSFNEEQRQIIRNAATISKLKPLELIEDTTAAATAYAIRKYVDSKEVGATVSQDSPQKLLVFQMGGSSTNIAIFEVKGKKVKLLGKEGSSTVGGDDFFLNMLKYVAEGQSSGPLDYKEWMEFVQECKQQMDNLCSSEHVSIKIKKTKIPFSRARFDEINETLLTEIHNMMTEALRKAIKEDVAQINKYILIGSGTLLPGVADFVAKRLGKSKRSEVLNANYAAVIGATHKADTLDTKLFKQKYKEKTSDQKEKLSKSKKKISALMERKQYLEEKKDLKKKVQTLISLIKSKEGREATPEEKHALGYFQNEARKIEDWIDANMYQIGDEKI